MLPDETIRAAILDLVASRAPRTACPSEAARALAADWRPLLADVRRVAFALAEDGLVTVTQRGRRVGPEVRGAIRIAQGAGGKRPASR